MLKYHPDKNQVDTTEIAQNITKLYAAGDLKGLQRILEGDHDNSVADLQSEISSITGTYFWIWGEGNESAKNNVETLFLSEDDLKAEKSKRRDSNIQFIRYFNQDIVLDDKTDEEINELYLKYLRP